MPWATRLGRVELARIEHAFRATHITSTHVPAETHVESVLYVDSTHITTRLFLQCMIESGSILSCAT